MRQSVDLDNQPPVEAHEIDDEVSDHDLTAEFRALASPIPNDAPDNCLGLHGVCSLRAGKATEGDGRNIGHGAIIMPSMWIGKVQSPSRFARLPSSGRLRRPARGEGPRAA